MSEWGSDEAARAVAHVTGAGLLGVLGAIARLAAEPGNKPMLRPAVILRIAGDASLGVGLFLIVSAMGYHGVWAMAASWIGGALGYAAIHDMLLRVLNKRLDG